MEEHPQPPGQDVLGYQLLLEQDQEDGDICVKGEVESWELTLKIQIYSKCNFLTHHLIVG